MICSGGIVEDRKVGYIYLIGTALARRVLIKWGSRYESRRQASFC